MKFYEQGRAEGSFENGIRMANGPVQRVQPFRETLALLATMGVKPRKTCVSC